MGEFDLIKRYFTAASYSADVLLGVGDDAAVVDVPAGYKLVTAVDTIVAGIHFPMDTAAADIAWRALAVNLSDMAAMGAIPRWFTLSLCLPDANESWLAEFAAGLNQLATRFDVQLVGGDTVKGPLNISVQMLGLVEQDGWLTRSGAAAGDVIMISGIPGEAASGLQLLLQPSITAGEEQRRHLLERFYRPTPRVQLGRAIRSVASAAMDVSDGLLTDLNKLCEASAVGALLNLELLPTSTVVNAIYGAAVAQQHALFGGDDYELLFTVPYNRVAQVQKLSSTLQVACTAIGEVTSKANASVNTDQHVQCFEHGKPVSVRGAGFDHFATNK